MQLHGEKTQQLYEKQLMFSANGRGTNSLGLSSFLREKLIRRIKREEEKLLHRRHQKISSLVT